MACDTSSPKPPEAPSLAQLEGAAIRLGLDHVRETAAGLGNPQSSFPIVLVAGTNGKGSTVAMLSSICREAGYRTGRFTSPHLTSEHERIAVDDEPISERELGDAFALALEAADERPTPFEALTYAAWLHFRRRRVDIAVMEVGLGGRLDATNACEPQLTVITAIALDHQRYLGDSVEAIADEKAGILRAEVPVVLAASTNPGSGRVVERALALAAPVVDSDLLTLEYADESASELEILASKGSYRVTPRLVGTHQLANLSLAVAAAEVLSDRGFPAIDCDAISQGISTCRWPGRCEWLDHRHSRSRVLLDVAHNPAAAVALAAYLECSQDRPRLIFGVRTDKDAAAMLRALEPVVSRIILTRPDDPRARDPHELASLVAPEIATEVVPSPELALEVATASPGAVLVTGSHSLVGEIRDRVLRQRHGDARHCSG